VTPILDRTVANGKSYQAGLGVDNFTIVHLYGTPYEQGYARGQLVGSNFASLIADFPTYIEQMIESKVKWLPQWLVDFVAVYGAPKLLDLTIDVTKEFTPASYIQEMQGMADATGIDMHEIWRINVFPEAIKAACTIVGANGPATPGGTLAHLRALDFAINNPLRDSPTVTVHHNQAQGKPSIANFGWSIMIGVLTGFAETGLGVGEKLWYGHDEYDAIRGKPWMFILRDAIEQANIWAALDSIQTANRTCAIHAGIGDANLNQFRGVEMAAKYFEVFNDTSLNYTEHPIIPGVVYWDKYVQPTHSYCLADLLQMYHGNLTAEVLALQVAPVLQTGDFHAITFDYANQFAYVANTQKTNVTQGLPNAYQRQYTKLDMRSLFKEQL
jgi:hypothetical protein